MLEDIAAELGMCGTMSFLLRKQVGDFYLSEAKTLEEIAAAPYAYLLPAEAAVQDLQELVLTDKQAADYSGGKDHCARHFKRYIPLENDYR